MFKDRTAVLVVLMAVSMVLIGTLLLGASAYLFLSDDENGEIVQAADQVGPACTFTGAGSELVVYASPVTDETRVVRLVRASAAYPVVARYAGLVVLQLDEDDRVWVDVGDGVLDGTCERVPVLTGPLADHDSVCVIAAGGARTLYDDPTLRTEVGTLRAGDYAGLRYTGEAYLLVLSETERAWVAAADVEIVRGACTSLPAPD